MTDLMKLLYQDYIKPNIENQPKDDAEKMQLDLLHNELDPQLRRTMQAVLALYAVQGFRLGLRTGLALESDLG